MHRGERPTEHHKSSLLPTKSSAAPGAGAQGAEAGGPGAGMETAPAHRISQNGEQKQTCG